MSFHNTTVHRPDSNAKKELDRDKDAMDMTMKRVLTSYIYAWEKGTKIEGNNQTWILSMIDNI